MNASNQPSPSTPAQSLNSTSLSKHVRTLFERANQTPAPGLILVALIQWLKDNPGGRDPAWVEAVLDAAVAGEAESPEALYQNLSDPSMEQAESLEEAAAILMGLAREFVTPPAE
jgi:hypothetical protein